MNRSPKWPHSWSRRYIFQSPIIFWHGSSIFWRVPAGKTWFAVENEAFEDVYSIQECGFLNSNMLNCPSFVNFHGQSWSFVWASFTRILDWSFVSLVFQTVFGFVCWNWGFSQGLILRKGHWANWMMKKIDVRNTTRAWIPQTQFSWRLCVEESEDRLDAYS